MASPKMVVTVSIALALAAVLFVPLADIVNGSVGGQTVTNETLTAQTGEYQGLGGYDLEDSETVYWLNSSSGNYETLAESTDYEVRYDSGEVKPLAGGAVSDGDELQVTYTYAATGPIVTTLVVLVPTLLALLMLVVAAAPVMEGL